MFIHLSLTALAPTLTTAAIQRLLPEEPLISISFRESSSGSVVILQTRTEDEAKRVVTAWTRTVLGCALLTAGYTFSNSKEASASHLGHETEEALV
jgi:hypothetical protein